MWKDTPAPWVDDAFAQLRVCKKLGKVVEAVGPPQLRVAKDPFAAMLLTIVSQQVSGKAADSIFKRVRENVGVRPAAFEGWDVDRLRTLGLTRAKAVSMSGLAEACRNGFSFKALAKLDDVEIYERLTAFKGIGRWSAEMFMMFSLGRPDVYSPGDLGLRRGLKIVYKIEEMPQPEDCEKLFRRWRPYRTAASWYLWRVAEGPGTSAW